MHALVEMNQLWLRQATALLRQITPAQFLEPPRGLAPHRVASQVRHVVEFYECFLAGLDLGHVNYDGRARDARIEASPSAAIERIDAIVKRLGSLRSAKADATLLITMEDAPARGIAAPLLSSSVGRELMALSSHTIHHFALVAITLRAHGVHVHADFGVAPSTLSFRATQARPLPEAA